MKYAFLFWVFVFISLNNYSYAAGREADDSAEDIAYALRNGELVSAKTIERMFASLKAVAGHHETKSDGSKKSTSTTSSSSSDGLIKGIEFIIDEVKPTHKTSVDYTPFIDLLNKIAATMEPEVFQKGVKLIMGRLGY